VKYLGHILSTTGVRPDPDKIKVLLDWETPRNLKEVQPFHGLGNYVNFARISRPLTNLMKKEAPFAWTPECETSFTTIKPHLADAAMQYHFDPKLPTVLAVDASDGATGAALHQLHPGPDQKPILRPIYDKGLLAIIRALEEWEPELLSLHDQFKISTDHRAFEYFRNSLPDKPAGPNTSRDLISRSSTNRDTKTTPPMPFRGRTLRYIRNCPTCCKLARNDTPPPLLRPLPIPDAPWLDISVDFIGPLPESNDHVVDRLTKQRHYLYTMRNCERQRRRRNLCPGCSTPFH
jgi:RNase H-like domain found in reverse transcriptase